jgi:hypothetical protein
MKNRRSLLITQQEINGLTPILCDECDGKKIQPGRYVKVGVFLVQMDCDKCKGNGVIYFDMASLYKTNGFMYTTNLGNMYENTVTYTPSPNWQVVPTTTTTTLTTNPSIASTQYVLTTNTLNFTNIGYYNYR